MDKKLNELRQARGRLCDELEALIGGDPAAFTAKEAEIAKTDASIAQCERALALAASRAQPSEHNAPGTPGTDRRDAEPIVVPYETSYSGRPVRKMPGFDHYLRLARAQLRADGASLTPLDHNKQPVAPFRSLGDQLIAVANYYLRGKDEGARDPRLVRAPTGAGEIDPSGGGFLVQTDFSTAVFMRSYDLGELLSRIDKLSLSTAANGIKIPGIDETSRVTGSRYGGVQSYWVGEGSSGAQNAKPKFRLIELDLKKLLSFMYVTDELLADQSVLTAIAGKAFSEELMFMTEDGIFEGDGNGKPLGVMNSPCLITVPAEVGQMTKTIVYENVLKMWSRCWSRSRQDAIWTINQDNEPQLYAMSQVIGTAGVPVYLPANGISGQPYGTLFGKPVITLEYNNTVGTSGDIMLGDWSQYVLADKGGVQAASSMHVAFLTDEMVFRFTYRVDGEPIWNAPLTPFKGSNTLSPFVALASR